MNDDFKTSFLTYYVQSLGERTREEKLGTKFGFDWIIYNLALAECHRALQNRPLVGTSKLTAM